MLSRRLDTSIENHKSKSYFTTVLRSVFKMLAHVVEAQSYAKRHNRMQRGTIVCKEAQSYAKRHSRMQRGIIVCKEAQLYAKRRSRLQRDTIVCKEAQSYAKRHNRMQRGATVCEEAQSYTKRHSRMQITCSVLGAYHAWRVVWHMVRRTAQLFILS